MEPCEINERKCQWFMAEGCQIPTWLPCPYAKEKEKEKKND